MIGDISRFFYDYLSGTGHQCRIICGLICGQSYTLLYRNTVMFGTP